MPEFGHIQISNINIPPPPLPPQIPKVYIHKTRRAKNIPINKYARIRSYSNFQHKCPPRPSKKWWIVFLNMPDFGHICILHTDQEQRNVFLDINMPDFGHIRISKISPCVANCMYARFRSNI